MTIWERLKGWKTLLVGIPFSILAIWDALAASGVDIQGLLPLPAYAAVVIAMTILRLVTTTPVFTSGEDE